MLSRVCALQWSQSVEPLRPRKLPYASRHTADGNLHSPILPHTSPDTPKRRAPVVERHDRIHWEVLRRGILDDEGAPQAINVLQECTTQQTHSLRSAPCNAAKAIGLVRDCPYGWGCVRRLWSRSTAQEQNPDVDAGHTCVW